MNSFICIRARASILFMSVIALAFFSLVPVRSRTIRWESKVYQHNIITNESINRSRNNSRKISNSITSTKYGQVKKALVKISLDNKQSEINRRLLRKVDEFTLLMDDQIETLAEEYEEIEEEMNGGGLDDDNDLEAEDDYDEVEIDDTLDEIHGIGVNELGGDNGGVKGSGVEITSNSTDTDHDDQYYEVQEPLISNIPSNDGVLPNNTVNGVDAVLVNATKTSPLANSTTISSGTNATPWNEAKDATLNATTGVGSTPHIAPDNEDDMLTPPDDKSVPFEEVIRKNQSIVNDITTTDDQYDDYVEIGKESSTEAENNKFGNNKYSDDPKNTNISGGAEDDSFTDDIEDGIDEMKMFIPTPSILSPPIPTVTSPSILIDDTYTDVIPPVSTENNKYLDAPSPYEYYSEERPVENENVYVPPDDDPVVKESPIFDDDTGSEMSVKEIEDEVTKEVEDIEQEAENMANDKYVRYVSIVSAILGVVFMLFVAQQMVENPNGTCAKICRVSVACLRLVVLPFRVIFCCYGCTQRSRDRRTHMVLENDADLELT